MFALYSSIRTEGLIIANFHDFVWMKLKFNRSDYHQAQQDIEVRQFQYWATLSTSDLCSYLWNEIRSLASNDFEQFDNICRWWNQCCYLKISNVLHFRLKTIINFVNLSPLLPPALYSNKQPDDPLIYARLHQHRQDQIFIDFSTDFTTSTSSLARCVVGWTTDKFRRIFPKKTTWHSWYGKPSAPVCVHSAHSPAYFCYRNDCALNSTELY